MKRLPRARVALALAMMITPFVAITTAPAAGTTTIMTVPAGLGGTATYSFSQAVWKVDSGNVVLRVQDTTTNLGNSLSCSDAMGHAVSCSIGAVRSVTLKPSVTLTPGQRYSLQVNPAGASSSVTDYLGVGAIPSASKDFIASLFEQENSLAASYSWRTSKTTSAFGGSYQSDYRANATFTFGFSGTSVTWYTVLGPSQGLAAT